MPISVEAYRASIGLFNCCFFDSMKLRCPAHFFDRYCKLIWGHGVGSWSQYVHGCKMNKGRINSNANLKYIIAYSLVLQVLLLLANDVESNPGPFSNLKICHCNIRSLRVKDRLVHIKCELHNAFDIISISETWLSSADKSESFSLPGYQPAFRRDRPAVKGQGGGVLAWVSSSIACKHRRDLERYDIEAMWLEVRLCNQRFLLCVVYRPPNSGQEFWELLTEKIEYIKEVSNMKIMIIGDLNAHFTTSQGDILRFSKSIEEYRYSPWMIRC